MIDTVKSSFYLGLFVFFLAIQGAVWSRESTDQVAEVERSADGASNRVMFQNKAGYYRVDTKNPDVSNCLLYSVKNLKDIELQIDSETKQIQGCKRISPK